MAGDGDRGGLGGRLLEVGTRYVLRAAEKVLNDPRGQDMVARAVGLAQRGRRRMEQVQERVMDAAGIPGRQDYQQIAKQLARIKRKAREFGERLQAERKRAPRDPAGGNGSG